MLIIYDETIIPDLVDIIYDMEMPKPIKYMYSRKTATHIPMSLRMLRRRWSFAPYLQPSMMPTVR